MGQRKGQTGNPAGKPKGAKNKIGVELKDKMKSFLEGNFDKFKADMEEVESPGFRCKLYIEAYKLIVPKPIDAKELEKEDEFMEEFRNRMFPKA